MPLSRGASTVADHNVLLKIGRGNQVENLQIAAGQLLPEVKYEFDLHGGDVRNYPFDKYSSLVTLTASERAAGGGEHAVPIYVTAWEAAPGFDVKAMASQQGNELRVQYEISRIGAVLFLWSCDLYSNAHYDDLRVDHR